MSRGSYVRAAAGPALVPGSGPRSYRSLLCAPACCCLAWTTCRRAAAQPAHLAYRSHIPHCTPVRGCSCAISRPCLRSAACLLLAPHCARAAGGRAAAQLAAHLSTPPRTRPCTPSCPLSRFARIRAALVPAGGRAVRVRRAERPGGGAVWRGRAADGGAGARVADKTAVGARAENRAVVEARGGLAEGRGGEMEVQVWGAHLGEGGERRGVGAALPSDPRPGPRGLLPSRPPIWHHRRSHPLCSTSSLSFLPSSAPRCSNCAVTWPWRPTTSERRSGPSARCGCGQAATDTRSSAES
jgi:hypothetical protein